MDTDTLFLCGVTKDEDIDTDAELASIQLDQNDTLTKIILMVIWAAKKFGSEMDKDPAYKNFLVQILVTYVPKSTTTVTDPALVQSIKNHGAAPPEATTVDMISVKEAEKIMPRLTNLILVLNAWSNTSVDSPLGMCQKNGQPFDLRPTTSQAKSELAHCLDLISKFIELLHDAYDNRFPEFAKRMARICGTVSVMVRNKTTGAKYRKVIADKSAVETGATLTTLLGLVFMGVTSNPTEEQIKQAQKTYMSTFGEIIVSKKQ